MINLYENNPVNKPRLETDTFFANYANNYSFSGIIDKTFKYIEDFQLLSPELWARFVNQFNEMILLSEQSEMIFLEFKKAFVAHLSKLVRHGASVYRQIISQLLSVKRNGDAGAVLLLRFFRKI